jgi:hypothetical protein
MSTEHVMLIKIEVRLCTLVGGLFIGIVANRQSLHCRVDDASRVCENI